MRLNGILERKNSMPKTNQSRINGFEIVKIKTELSHIKKELCSIKDEQKKLSAYANMGKGGLKVIIVIGYFIAIAVGWFIGQR